MQSASAAAEQREALALVHFLSFKIVAVCRIVYSVVSREVQSSVESSVECASE